MELNNVFIEELFFGKIVLIIVIDEAFNKNLTTEDNYKNNKFKGLQKPS
jgi:hypothetical protein